jgi:hypothetical protein
MLLANSIGGLMGGGANKAQASEASAKPEEHSPYEVNQKPEEASHYQDANDNDPGNYDSGDSSWGDGGGDIDI